MRIQSSLFAIATAFAVSIGTVGNLQAQALQFFAVLDGGNEPGGVGDLNSNGAAMVMLPGTPGALCFAILIRNTDTPNGAHIHSALPGINGPIVVVLTAPSSGNPGNSSGCISGVSASTISQLKATPTKFYINVHTGMKPNGALRGQLF